MSTTNSEFRLRPSRLYAAVCFIAHAGAVLALAVSHVPLSVIVLGGLLLCLNLWAELRLTAWRTAPRAVIAIRNEPQGWSLVRRNGSSTDAMRLQAARVLCGGLALTLAGEYGSQLRVVVAADALSPDALRRLRASAIAVGGVDER